MPIVLLTADKSPHLNAQAGVSQELNEAVGRIFRNGDLPQEIQVRSTDEIGQLAASFLNRMMEGSMARLTSTNEATAELKAVTDRVVGIVKSYRV